MTYAIGVAGVPGKASTEGLGEAFRRRGIEAFTFALKDAAIDLEEGRVICRDRRLDTLDALVIKKLGDSTDPTTPMRVNLAHYLAERGVRIFSRPAAIALVNDRYRMTTRLALAGIPIPATVITESLDEATAIIEAWGEAVLKPVFTSKGRGMTIVRPGEHLRHTLSDWAQERASPFYLQKLVKHAGRDLGVAMLGGQTLGAYYRVGAPGEWRTSVQLGGHYEAANLAPELRRLAERVNELFQLDFTVVDIVETADGPLVYEASAFGGFGGLAQSHGIDVAELYAEYVLDDLRRRE